MPDDKKKSLLERRKKNQKKKEATTKTTMEKIENLTNTKLTKSDVVVIIRFLKKVNGHDKALVKKLEQLFFHGNTTKKLTVDDGKNIVKLIRVMLTLRGLSPVKKYDPVPLPENVNGFKIAIVDSITKIPFPLCPGTDVEKRQFIFDIKSTTSYEINIWLARSNSYDSWFKVVDPKIGDESIDYIKAWHSYHDLAEIKGMRPNSDASFRLWSASAKGEADSDNYNVTNKFNITLVKSRKIPYVKPRPPSPPPPRPTQHRSRGGDFSGCNFHTVGMKAKGGGDFTTSKSSTSFAGDFGAQTIPNRLQAKSFGDDSFAGDYGAQTIPGGVAVPTVHVNTTRDTFKKFDVPRHFELVIVCSQDAEEKRASNITFKVKLLFAKDKFDNYINSDIIQIPSDIIQKPMEKMEQDYTAGISTEYINSNPSKNAYGIDWY